MATPQKEQASALLDRISKLQARLNEKFASNQGLSAGPRKPDEPKSDTPSFAHDPSAGSSPASGHSTEDSKFDGASAAVEQCLEEIKRALGNLAMPSRPDSSALNLLLVSVPKIDQLRSEVLETLSGQMKEMQTLSTELEEKRRELEASRATCEKSAALEERLTELNKSLDSVTQENVTLKEELYDTQATLNTAERSRSELCVEATQLREKISQLTLREEELEQEHENIITEMTEKVKGLQTENEDRMKLLQDRDAELRHAKEQGSAQLAELDKMRANEAEMTALVTTLKAKLAAQESATEESKDREESLAAQLQAFAEKEAALKGEVMMLHQQASERDRAKEAELEEEKQRQAARAAEREQELAAAMLNKVETQALSDSIAHLQAEIKLLREKEIASEAERDKEREQERQAAADREEHLQAVNSLLKEREMDIIRLEREGVRASEQRSRQCEEASVANTTADDKQIDDNTEIDRSELTITSEVVGSGAFAQVVKGLWQREVAVKRFAALTEQSQLDACALEIRILSRLSHPGIARFYGTATQLPDIHIVMEMVKGPSLETLTHNRAPGAPAPDLPLLLSISLQLAEAMAYVHANDIIHRDLKPGNVLISSTDGAVKLIDFGLALVGNASTLTVSSAVAGTPVYLAPEVLREEGFNNKVDVYSFAIVLWEIITCQLPWYGLDLQGMVLAVVHRNQRPQIPTTLAPELQQLLNDCWRPEPGRRPPFKAIAAALVAAGATSLARPRGPMASVAAM